MRLQRRHWVSALALGAAVGAVVVVWNHTQFVGHEVGRRFTENLLFERGYRLDVDAVRGAPFGDLYLVRPRITAVASPGDTLLRADAIRVRIRSWRGLLGGRVAISNLRIERATIDWPQAWPQPRPLPPGAEPVTPPTSRFPLLDIDALEIVGLTVRSPSRDVWASDVHGLVQVRSRRDRVELQIDHGRAALPSDSLRIESVRADGVWYGDSLVVSDVDFATAGSQIVGEGTLRVHARQARANVTVDRLDVVELGRFVDPVRGHTGNVAGVLRIDWRPPLTRLQGTLGGTVDSLAVENAEFDVEQTGDGLRVRDARGVVAGANVDLTGFFGDGVMHGKVEFASLDLHALVPERAATLPAHDLTGEATFERRSRDDSLRVQWRLHDSRVDRIVVARAQGSVAQHGDGLRLRDGELETPHGTLRAAGTVDARTIAAEFVLDTHDVAGALADWKFEGPAGDLRAHGRVDGARESPRLEAEAEFATLQWGAATLRDGHLAVWGHDLRARRAEVEVRADSLRVAGRALHDLAADITIEGPVVRIARAQATRGDTLIAAAARYTRTATDWTGVATPTSHLQLETVLLRLGHQEVRVEEPVDIWWRGSEVRVDSLRLVTRGGLARVDAMVDRARRTLDVRATVDGLDLAYVAPMLPQRPPLAGRAFGEIAARGSWDASHIDGNLHVVGARWNAFAVDSLGIVLTSGAKGVEASVFRITTPHGDVHGRVHVGRLPPLGRIWEPAPGEREAWAAAPIDGSLHLQDVDVERWVARGDPEALPRFSAQLTADVTLAGTLGAPQLTARGRGDNIAVGPREVGSADFHLTAGDGRIHVQKAQVHNGDQIVQVRGTLPARLDFTRGFALERDQPIDADVVLPRSSFALVQRFVPLFEPGLPGMSPGEIEAELSVAGTLATPEVRGDFTVYDASFTLRDMEEVYREVDARGRFDGATLQVNDITARTGRDGILRGGGQLELDGATVTGYHYRFNLENVPVYSIPDITATVSGRLSIQGVAIGDALVPLISDTLDVREALITQEFSSGAEAEIFDTDTPEWLSNILLRAPNGNVRLRNSQVEAELAGTLRILRTRRQLDLLGEVTVRRGRYLDLVNYFRITGGRLDFGPNPGFNPMLDIDGETGRPGNRVYVHLSGSALAPQLTFRSEQDGVEGSSQIEEQVIGRIGSGGAVASNAVATVGGGLLRELQFLRGQSITVDPAGEDPAAAPEDAQNEFGVNLSTGFAISDNVYLIYTQGVKSDIQQKAALELDLRRWPLLLEAAYERRTLSEGGPDQPQNAFDINLKYRHEY